MEEYENTNIIADEAQNLLEQNQEGEQNHQQVNMPNQQQEQQNQPQVKSEKVKQQERSSNKGLLIIFFYYLLVIKILIINQLLSSLFHDDQQSQNIKHHSLIQTNIIKPQLDQNQYQFQVLKNGLKVLLISDKNAKSGYAAMDVNVGSWSQPKEWPGLPHFLEHMLFLRSKSISTKQYFDIFLSENGGSSNAYTSNTNTNYYYEISQQGFEKSVLLFAHMFLDPQFEEEDVNKESSAVNGEYEINLNNDDWKLQNLFSIITQDGHPQHQFTTGNDQSLKKEGVIQALREFHDKYYSANLMSLVLYSNLKIEEMQTLLQKANFDEIKNNQVQKPNFVSFGKYFDNQTLGSIFKLHVNEQSKILYLIFQIEVEDHIHYKDRVFEYINSHLSHSGKSGFYQKMIEKKLIIDYQYGIYDKSENYLLYGVGIYLTEEGFTDIGKVVNCFINLFKKIENEGVSENLFNQQKQLTKLFFDFSETQINSYYQISDYATKLNNYPAQDVLALDYQYNQFNQKFIQSIVKQICDPNNVLFVVSANFGNPEVSKSDVQNDPKQQQTEDNNNTQNASQTNQTNQQQNNNSNNSNASQQEIPSTQTQSQQQAQNSNNNLDILHIFKNKVFLQQANIDKKKNILQITKLLQEKRMKQSLQNLGQQKLIKKNDIHNNKMKNDKLMIMKKLKKTKKNNEIESKIQQQSDNPEILLHKYQLFLHNNQFDQYSQLYNVYWSKGEKIDQVTLNNLFKTNQQFMSQFTLKDLNPYIPENTELISLCKGDPNKIDEDLQKELQSILNENLIQKDSSSINIAENEGQEDQNNDNYDPLSDKKRYKQFIFEKFEPPKDSSQCPEAEQQYEKNHPYPGLIQMDNRGQSWYKLERQFKVPEASINAHLKTVIQQETGLQRLKLQCYNIIIYNIIEQEMSQAKEAGYQFDIQLNKEGLNFQVYGWSDKVTEVAINAAKIIKEIVITEELINQAKVQLVHSLQDDLNYSPLQQGIKIHLMKLIKIPYYNDQQLIQLVENIRLTDMVNFHKELFDNYKLCTLLIGNIKLQQSRHLINQLYNTFGGFHSIEETASNIQIANINNQSLIYRNWVEGDPQNLNSVTANYYQIGQGSFNKILMSNILQGILNNHMFSFLRTQKELGYIAFSKLLQINCVNGFLVAVVGSKELPHIVNGQMEEGLIQFDRKLRYMTNEEFIQIKVALQQGIEENDLTLIDKVNSFWEFVNSEQYVFDYQKIINKEIDKITLTQTHQFYQSIFKYDVAKLSIQLYSRNSIKELPTTVNDIQNFNTLQSTLLNEENMTLVNKEDCFNCFSSFSTLQTITKNNQLL